MRVVLLFLSTFCFTQIYSQSKTLPYFNDFSTQADQDEMEIYRLGQTAVFGWSFTQTTNPYVSHDYPVGGNGDTVSDWLVSPLLNLGTGAMISFKYNVYGITGQATSDDEFSIWAHKGNGGPDSTWVKVSDLTQTIGTSTSFKDTGNISIPIQGDSIRIAFKYRATNNWFVVALDSVKVYLNGLGTSTNNKLQVRVYPNPVKDELSISSANNISKISISNMFGATVLEQNVNNQKAIIQTGNLPAGTYILTTYSNLIVSTRKIQIMR